MCQISNNLLNVVDPIWRHCSDRLSEGWGTWVWMWLAVGPQKGRSESWLTTGAVVSLCGRVVWTAFCAGRALASLLSFWFWSWNAQRKVTLNSRMKEAGMWRCERSLSPDLSLFLSLFHCCLLYYLEFQFSFVLFSQLVFVGRVLMSWLVGMKLWW